MLENRWEVGANPESLNVPTQDRASGMGVAKVRCAATRPELRQLGGKVTWEVGSYGVGDDEVVRSGFRDMTGNVRNMNTQISGNSNNIACLDRNIIKVEERLNEKLNEILLTLSRRDEPKPPAVTVENPPPNPSTNGDPIVVSEQTKEPTVEVQAPQEVPVVPVNQTGQPIIGVPVPEGIPTATAVVTECQGRL
ncbi:uncharacterized protein EI90DRAFT_3124431 [Cantharellus anzutake]|uniref:uncharacterized protein n=1 Tax=Cantharellus anzutake TaxID=1750568 RepID=UPI0019049252|nr:uncharacterized protein EI90DRAFT_3124431 [Cantharellus anzutake]KAF8330384.1 hypothetical protein EI90DRAFT_3124431 [Cantharellus anzutake]